MNDKDLFGGNDLDGDEVIVDVTAGITTATTPQIFKYDVTQAQTLIEIKAAKPRARGVIKPLKKKDQLAFDEEVTRKLDAQMKAEMEEEERITKEKDEANRAVIEE
nr:hypothetical protein [Tanacetum cinerariifolium]